MSGTLLDTGPSDSDAAHQYTGRFETGLKKCFIGIGFVAIAIAMLFGRNHDWWIMLVPAAILLGKGMSQILALKFARRLPSPVSVESSRVDAVDQSQYRLLVDPAPPSVTEHTTRNMNAARDRNEA